MVSLDESLLTLAQAARTLPNLRGNGNGVNAATVWRWAIKGCKGVRLETAIIGGIRYTSREALERFVVSTTAAVDGTTTVPLCTARQREAAIAAAERELAAS